MTNAVHGSVYKQYTHIRRSLIYDTDRSIGSHGFNLLSELRFLPLHVQNHIASKIMGNINGRRFYRFILIPVRENPSFTLVEKEELPSRTAEFYCKMEGKNSKLNVTIKKFTLKKKKNLNKQLSYLKSKEHLIEPCIHKLSYSI